MKKMVLTDGFTGSFAKLNTSDDEAMELVYESNKFVLLNHWFWCLWAVNQVVLEGVDDFDYITYAESRAKQYWYLRK